MSDFLSNFSPGNYDGKKQSSPKETEFDEKTERKAEPIPDSQTSDQGAGESKAAAASDPKEMKRRTRKETLNRSVGSEKKRQSLIQLIASGSVKNTR